MGRGELAKARDRVLPEALTSTADPARGADHRPRNGRSPPRGRRIQPPMDDPPAGTSRRLRRLTRLWAAPGLILLATHCAGCAALPVATLGTLLGVTASAVSTGTEIYQLGKLDTAEIAALGHAAEASRCAAADLCLHPRREQWDKGQVVRLVFADSKHARIKVRLERRTARLVRVRVDVGWFGSEATARLFLGRLRARLPPPRFARAPPADSAGPHFSPAQGNAD